MLRFDLKDGALLVYVEFEPIYFILWTNREKIYSVGRACVKETFKLLCFFKNLQILFQFCDSTTKLPSVKYFLVHLIKFSKQTK